MPQSTTEHAHVGGRTPKRTNRLGPLAAIVGFLAFVEFTSGVLQGFYVPLLTDIARHLNVHDADVNWLEGTQLMLSALVVPALAKLGDMVGHKRMLLVSTAVTAAASAVLPFTDSFAVFLAAWALQGFYVAWLPLEVALIWSRARGGSHPAGLTAKAAGVLVAALEGGAIVGALLSGQLVDTMALGTLLIIPAALVTICFFVIWFGVKESPNLAGGRFDTVGMVLIALALVALTGGLSLLRLNGAGSLIAWGVIALGLLLVVPFVRYELGNRDPLIDVRMFRNPALWPVFLTAGLFGVSVLGAQAPLSTFARTDPALVGYGLGVNGFAVSLIIGIYLIAMVVGALLSGRIGRLVTPRLMLVGASVLIAIGYLLFLPNHASYAGVIVNMVLAGLGSGALVASLPATAASAAPSTQTGVATGLTNTVKTVGGAIASCVFGIALLNAVAGASGTGTTAGSFSGYVTVWVVCGVTALIAAACLLFVVPKHAFVDASAHAAAAD